MFTQVLKQDSWQSVKKFKFTSQLLYDYKNYRILLCAYWGLRQHNNCRRTCLGEATHLITNHSLKCMKRTCDLSSRYRSLHYCVIKTMKLSKKAPFCTHDFVSFHPPKSSVTLKLNIVLFHFLESLFTRWTCVITSSFIHWCSPAPPHCHAAHLYRCVWWSFRRAPTDTCDCNRCFIHIVIWILGK